MNLKINQYYNEIYLKNLYESNVLEIIYYGTFVGNFLVDANVFMNSNKIIIFGMESPVDNKLLMNYEGNFLIKRVYTYENGKQKAGGVKHYFDEIENIYSRLDTSDSKWEELDKTNRYYKNVSSLLSYKKNNRRYYLTKRNGYAQTSQKLNQSSKKILNKLIAKRG